MSFIVKVKTGLSTVIYEQIYLQVKQYIMNGNLKADQQVPSIRGLAKDAQVSVITIKKPYEELERDGFIYSIPSKGYYVKAQDTGAIKKYYQDEMKLLIKEMKTHADTLNMSDEELIQFIKDQL